MRQITMTWGQLEKLQPRPEAQVFRMFNDEEMNDFLAGMRVSGYRNDEPLIIYKGELLDGRNRLSGALTLNREGVLTSPPPCVEFEDSDGSPMGYVVEKNHNRRHLSATDKAVAAEKAMPIFEAEAEKRRREGNRLGGKKSGSSRRGEVGDQKSPDFTGDAGRAVEHAAKAFGASPANVKRVRRTRKNDPDLYARLEAGEMTASAAEKEGKRRRGVRSQAKRSDAGTSRKEAEQKKKPKLDMPWVPPEDSDRPIWHRDGINYPLNPNGDNRMASFRLTFSYRDLARCARIIKSYLTANELEVFQNELREQDVECYPEFGFYNAADGAAEEPVGVGAD